MNDLTKNVLVFIVIIVVLLSVVQGLSNVNSTQVQEVGYSEFLDRVRSGSVDVAKFSDDNKRIDFGDRQALRRRASFLDRTLRTGSGPAALNLVPRERRGGDGAISRCAQHRDRRRRPRPCRKDWRVARTLWSRLSGAAISGAI